MTAYGQKRKFAWLTSMSGESCSESFANSDSNGRDEHKQTFDANFRFP